MRRIDVEALRRLAAEGMPARQIGEAMGFHAEVIRDCAKRHGITLPPGNHRAKEQFEWWARNHAELVHLREMGTPLREIARRLGTTPSAVAGRLQRNGLCDSNWDQPDSLFWQAHTAQAVQWRAEGVTIAEIGRRLGKNPSTVERRLARVRRREQRPVPKPAVEFPPSGHCVFPLGDPADAGFHFCGERTPELLAPYCSSHHRVAYRPAPPMQVAA